MYRSSSPRSLLAARSLRTCFWNSLAAAGLEGRCEEALRQIDSRGYGDALKDSFDSVFCYGIAFYKKKCLVLAK